MQSLRPKSRNRDRRSGPFSPWKKPARARVAELASHAPHWSAERGRQTQDHQQASGAIARTSGLRRRDPRAFAEPSRPSQGTSSAPEKELSVQPHRCSESQTRAANLVDPRCVFGSISAAAVVASTSGEHLWVKSYRSFHRFEGEGITALGDGRGGIVLVENDWYWAFAGWSRDWIVCFRGLWVERPRS